MRRIVTFGVVALAPAAGTAQAPRIQDNSFLIEEAYNQEAGVVQHIGTFARGARTGDWSFGFTQEWPFRGRRHQLSYTMTLDRVGGPGTGHTGVGDLMLNYRYQTAGLEGGAVFISPRLSVVLPTGDAGRGHGVGGVALEAALPISIDLSSRLTVHLNARAGFVSAARSRAVEGVAARSLAGGGSLVWAAASRVNLLVETVAERALVVDGNLAGPARTVTRTAWVLNPGVRWAHDFKGGLQIVPGIAYTVDLHGARDAEGLFLYLSFEHPFRRIR